MPSAVYYIKTGNADSVEDVSRRLDRLIEKSAILDFIREGDFTGIKLHFGEEGNTGYIHREWVKCAVKRAHARTKNLFLTDSNVLYKNSRRTNSVEHLKVASEHGFDLGSIGAPILIADGLFGRNYTEVAIKGKHFSKVKIASDIADSDSLLVMSHVTGHIQTGLAASLKNLGMGCASRRGKHEQHSGIVPEVNMKFCVGCGLCALDCPAAAITMKAGKAQISDERCIGCGECVVVCRTKAIQTKWSETLENLQEKMVEYAHGVISALKGQLGYINFMIKVTRNCDCLEKGERRMTDDLGILASRDPVAIDKAAADLLNSRHGRDIFREKFPDIDWTVQLKHAAGLGLGDLDYKLVEVKSA